MKRIIMITGLALAMVSCSNNGGQTGVQDDGIKSLDANGALPDSVGQYYNSQDSTGMEHRVDTERRDSSGQK